MEQHAGLLNGPGHWLEFYLLSSLGTQAVSGQGVALLLLAGLHRQLRDWGVSPTVGLGWMWQLAHSKGICVSVFPTEQTERRHWHDVHEPKYEQLCGVHGLGFMVPGIQMCRHEPCSRHVFLPSLLPCTLPRPSETPTTHHRPHGSLLLHAFHRCPGGLSG